MTEHEGQMHGAPADRQAGKPVARRSPPQLLKQLPIWAPVPFLMLALVAVSVYGLASSLWSAAQSALFALVLGTIVCTAVVGWLISLDKVQRDVRANELHFRNIVEQSLEGIYQTSPGGRWLSANPALARMLGYESAEEMLASDVDLNHEFYAEPGKRAEFIRQMQQEDAVRDFESEVIAKDGRRMWISESGRAVRDGAGGLLYYEGRTMDITERRKAQEALKAEHERQGVWILDLESRTREIGLLSELSSMLQSCNTLPEAYSIVAEHTRWLLPEHAGALYVLGEQRNYHERVAAWGTPEPKETLIEPEDCWALRRGHPHRAVIPLQADLPNTQPAIFCRHVHAPLPRAHLCIPLVAQGETMGLLHLRLPATVASAGAGSERQTPLYSDSQLQLAQTVAGSLAVAMSNIRMQQVLHEQSVHDPLTGLYNRRFLEEAMDVALARVRASGGPLSVMMVDIDHFKRFNDSHGHEAGDSMLHELGRFLSSEMREEDVACRYGGEEFALIMEGATLQVARERAEELRKGARDLTLHFRHQVLGPLTLSVGLAQYPAHAQTARDLLRAADAALYRAKSAGRDQVRVAEIREVVADAALA